MRWGRANSSGEFRERSLSTEGEEYAYKFGLSPMFWGDGVGLGKCANYILWMLLYSTVTAVEFTGRGGFFLACEDFGRTFRQFIPRLRLKKERKKSGD